MGGGMEGVVSKSLKGDRRRNDSHKLTLAVKATR